MLVHQAFYSVSDAFRDLASARGRVEYPPPVVKTGSLHYGFKKRKRQIKIKTNSKMCNIEGVVADKVTAADMICIDRQSEGSGS